MYTINNKNKIDWNAKGKNRIIQNVRNLLNIYRYDIPFDRIRGLNSELVDNPINKIDELKINIIETIEKYEPRVIVENLTIITEKNELIIEVNIGIND